MKFNFSTSQQYSRRDIAIHIGLPDLPKRGIWATGYLQHEGAFFVFANVGTPGRTGHDYPNQFVNDELIWSGKSKSHKNQPVILKMLSPGAEVHLFWRSNNKDKYFNYAGIASPVSISDDIPVIIRWKFIDPCQANKFIPEEIELAKNELPVNMIEGAIKQTTVNAYERNHIARQICLAAFGYKCAVCDFNFEEFYGEIGHGFIHVHHLIPISSIGSNYKIDPIKDLIPLCPNCHAMVHRTSPPIEISTLKALINKIS